jgi:hypothetical protein
MGIFKKSNSQSSSGIECPKCSSRGLGLGYVDRVACTVLHCCERCGNRWRDQLIDLVDQELARRTRV